MFGAWYDVSKISTPELPKSGDLFHPFRGRVCRRSGDIDVPHGDVDDK
jgi:hypothetical protein